MGENQHKIEWREGVPVSLQFDDPFYSLDDGLAEAEHVFLAGNDLPARFRDGFHIGELGFGTGLNFLAALRAFRRADRCGHLRFTSFEAYPITVEDRRAALRPFTDLPVEALSEPVGPDYHLTVITGDVRETLPAWDGFADAWFLDGFSPAKNPEMWGDAVLTAVAARTARGGTFATFTAVGHVRRSLAAAGFSVERVKGHARKRHMTKGYLA